MDICAFRYALKFQIAAAVPFNDTISYTALAAKCKVDESQLKQALRQMMMCRFFHEPVHDQVAHTAASKQLTHPGALSWIQFTTTDTIGTAYNYLDAIAKWGHGSQEPNQTGQQLLYNTDKYMYDYYEENDEVRTNFSELMTYVSSMNAMSNEYVGAGYDWAGLGEVTIVDVAGNVGHCSVEMAKANPKAQIVVQDLPGIIERAKDPKTCVTPEEYRSRYTFMAHNFYDEQPVHADVYFLRMIMHDYSDKYCIKILQPLVKAMKPNGRIIIMDAVMPPVGGAPMPIERFMRAQDMHMCILTNAKERDQEQWEQLVRDTDPRLRINSITTPPGSAKSLIEIVLGPELNGQVDGKSNGVVANIAEVNEVA